jgi:hypothetical protein
MRHVDLVAAQHLLKPLLWGEIPLLLYGVRAAYKEAEAEPSVGSKQRLVVVGERAPAYHGSVCLSADESWECLGGSNIKSATVELVSSVHVTVQ